MSGKIFNRCLSSKRWQKNKELSLTEMVLLRSCFASVLCFSISVDLIDVLGPGKRHDHPLLLLLTTLHNIVILLLLLTKLQNIRYTLFLPVPKLSLFQLRFVLTLLPPLFPCPLHLHSTSTTCTLEEICFLSVRPDRRHQLDLLQMTSVGGFKSGSRPNASGGTMQLHVEKQIFDTVLSIFFA